MENLTGSEIVLKSLRDQDVDVIFGYPGGAVLPIYDSLFKQNAIKHILVRQEAGAVHAAEGYAKSSGKVGVVLVTSGPGATNIVTGLTDAIMDSVPLVCITGQVPQHLIGSDAFQECDTTGITRPCTKHNYLVKDVNSLSEVIHEAFTIAKNGRPGPVVIDIPKDVQFSKGSYKQKKEFLIPKHRLFNSSVIENDKQIEEATKLIAHSKKPIFYIGGGCINSGPEASKLVQELVKLTSIPSTMTLMGLGTLPASDPNSLGMLGMHGMYEANLAMHDCDVMVNIGARFDDRVTGRLDAFSPNSKKIHIDIEASNINKNIKVDIPLIGDVTTILKKFLTSWKQNNYSINKNHLNDWWKKINEWKKVDCLNFSQNGNTIKPQYAVKRLYELTKDINTIITTEVGQHQMWAAQYYKFEKPNKWITSGGLGTMGFGFPAAIGAQVANPKALVVDIAGDGSILMNIQEISTAVQHRLPVKIFILNNEYMGMVRQWQELLHGGRYSESYMDSLPDFVSLAESFKAKGLRATKSNEIDDVIKEMIEYDGPVIADIIVDKEENCFPMIQSGSAHNEMVLNKNQKQDSKSAEKGKILV
ncbi:MAG: Acetolactate synthase isozyme 3 large subunit [Alphaproteobacteria bacterium MarineAlpha5_Bin8]|nr:MAG: Acetolactate synthase isozyme 3 large subunit [Alphaproteobacteria bacterium MarineAlpha5_Bin7]PPR48217.1 MAG: Acetolactate synthase isozyme 3 large subunit [Alphaproteobacteria bacterium MarineAlpha5_Bin8]PPR53069.1 MAG: Acetolactate synthase isozyme 3 large subunit [Alphaproteobacteria bacterium MarineAlpha5_Bin6]|tara:strand:+ start:346 stop:2109 length:1764 start_codon:yes stop_codon:yes gene_type:complete